MNNTPSLAMQSSPGYTSQRASQIAESDGQQAAGQAATPSMEISHDERYTRPHTLGNVAAGEAAHTPASHGGEFDHLLTIFGNRHYEAACARDETPEEYTAAFRFSDKARRDVIRFYNRQRNARAALVEAIIPLIEYAVRLDKERNGFQPNEPECVQQARATLVEAQVTAPAVNLTVEAPEWSVVGVPYADCEDRALDRINVYQNGALMAIAQADELTHDALYELTRRANSHVSLVNCLEGTNTILQNILLGNYSPGEQVAMITKRINANRAALARS